MRWWWNSKPRNITKGIPPDPYVEATWFRRRWIALDQAANVWFLNGLPDETISSHAGRMHRIGDPPVWARFVCWLCEKFDQGHCDESIGH